MSEVGIGTAGATIDVLGVGTGLGSGARASYAEADQATLLGLYHGYDQARIALAKLVSRFGSDAPSDEETERRIWARARRNGIARDLFKPPSALPSSQGLNLGAHSAVLSAFATISQQADELLAAIAERWPHLREDAGGPLPVQSVPADE